MGWDGAILTDSGSYQVFSLNQSAFRRRSAFPSAFGWSISDDDSKYVLKSKSLWVWTLRWLLMNALSDPASRDRVAIDPTNDQMVETLSSRTYQKWDDGFVQDCARRDVWGYADCTFKESFSWFNVSAGGPSLRPTEKLLKHLRTTPHLPSQRFYLMGVGPPWDIGEAVINGIDVFDCVIPRNARNGKVVLPLVSLISRMLNMQKTNLRWTRTVLVSLIKISRAYLRHLYVSQEILGAHLLTRHNLHFIINMSKIRGDFWEPTILRNYESAFLESTLHTLIHLYCHLVVHF